MLLMLRVITATSQRPPHVGPADDIHAPCSMYVAGVRRAAAVCVTQRVWVPQRTNYGRIPYTMHIFAMRTPLEATQTAAVCASEVPSWWSRCMLWCLLVHRPMWLVAFLPPL